MTDLVQRLRQIAPYFAPHALVLVEAADALEAKDKEIATMRYENAIRFGTSHPEMYKTELDEAKESIEHYKSGLGSALQDIAKYKTLCDQMANALDQLTFTMDLRLDDGDLSSETRDAFSALAAWREMK